MTLLVGRDGKEVLRLGGHGTGGKALEDLTVDSGGAGFVMQPQQGMRLGDEQLREEFGGRQIAVPVVEIHPLGRHDAEVRRPDLVEALHEREACRLLGINLHRDKAGGDRVDHLGIRVRHGTQALAAASGRREEIQQHKFMVLACLMTGRSKVVCPLDRSHVSILPIPHSSRPQGTMTMETLYTCHDVESTPHTP